MEPRRAPPGIVLLGPFWTRRRVQRHLHRPADAVTSDLALLRLASPIGLGEAYPAFQFDDHGVRPDAATLNLLLHRRVDDLRACDWYAEPLPRLGHLSPLGWLLLGGEYEQLLDVLPEPVWPFPGAPRVVAPRWERVVVRPRGYRAPWHRRGAPSLG